MSDQSYKTVSANKESVDKKWVLIDAKDAVLGRLASNTAKILRGKNKPCFTPHVDCGDNVIIINAEKINLSGNKWADKTYIRHTGYPGGQRVRTATEMMTKFPDRMVMNAVKGMLPKNRLGKQLLTNLRVYVGEDYKEVAQKPEKIDLNNIKL
ncbi:LSU ribosomal protein L13P [Balneicella halophila]|uniref:Large ribosomal subunit protein uL13 n=1 Tax=Balneicella halophila TaxID=1537566 RepID=A0A7L4UQL8_BALHA|nr:50S ribosomal protein L13 [Balneicella halophila]PVX52066.1 LSU ribosomal protein L13P [Balneicella halophila]